MAKLTPEQLQQLRDAKQWLTDRGEDASGVEICIGLGEKQAAGQDPPADQT
jgi:hypothetical protein